MNRSIWKSFIDVPVLLSFCARHKPPISNNLRNRFEGGVTSYPPKMAALLTTYDFQLMHFPDPDSNNDANRGGNSEAVTLRAPSISYEEFPSRFPLANTLEKRRATNRG